jgi:hypothetical protein
LSSKICTWSRGLLKSHFPLFFISYIFPFFHSSWDSSFYIVPRLWAWWPGFNFGRVRDFFPFATMSRLALGLTQHPIKWILGTVSTGVKQPWAHLCLVPRLKMFGAIPPLPICSHCMSLKSNTGYILMVWYLVKCRDFMFLPLPIFPLWSVHLLYDVGISNPWKGSRCCLHFCSLGNLFPTLLH